VSHSLSRLVRHCILVGVAVWTVNAQLTYRVPGSAASAVLPWLGTGLSVLTLLLMIGGLIRRLPAEDRVRRFLQVLERLVTFLVLGLAVYGVVLGFNARFAVAPPQVHTSTVVALLGGEPDSTMGAAYAWADLRSWRTAGRTERVILRAWERRTLWTAKQVLVHVRPGRLGLPWIMKIEPDEEERLRSVLQFAPTASRPWKELIGTYFRRGDYDRAASLAKEYLSIYPNDRDFAIRFASDLFSASRWPAAVPILEPFLRGRPDAKVYGLLGFAMTRAGRQAEGVAVLERAIPLDPHHWWTYYALAYAHFYAGEFAEAAPWFERVLELRPNFPEIEERLRTIRSRQRNPGQRGRGRRRGPSKGCLEELGGRAVSGGPVLRSGHTCRRFRP
jgi:tetratricopeptide (TPR) repeat protein